MINTHRIINRKHPAAAKYSLSLRLQYKNRKQIAPVTLNGIIKFTANICADTLTVNATLTANAVTIKDP